MERSRTDPVEHEAVIQRLTAGLLEHDAALRRVPAAHGQDGGDLVLGTLGRASPGFVGVIGFDAIALALLGRSHPFGVVAAGLLFGGLAAGGQQMQATTDVGIDIVQVIQALIIVFIAAPALIKAIYRVKADTEAAQVSSGWGT